VWVKICGITNLADAKLAFELGADAVGLNLVPSSRRYLEPKRAVELAQKVGGAQRVVFVVADRPIAELEELQGRLPGAWLQLHGSEPPELVARLLPRAFKAVPIATAADVPEVGDWPGERLLADTKVGGRFGGTGAVFDWALVEGLARARALVLAGGLRPENVAAAVAAVGPWGVDVAGGVEDPADPRRKSAPLLEAFLREARRAR
jgi:phosphoribosylanthranilate isomerase